jgi:hypothetical protein
MRFPTSYKLEVVQEHAPATSMPERLQKADRGILGKQQS